MHRAGQKIRQWREAQSPPLSAEEFGARFGEPAGWPSRTVYGWEAKGKIARAAVQKRLADLGICGPADWLEPAAPSGRWRYRGSCSCLTKSKLDRIKKSREPTIPHPITFPDVLLDLLAF